MTGRFRARLERNEVSEEDMDVLYLLLSGPQIGHRHEQYPDANIKNVTLKPLFEIK